MSKVGASLNSRGKLFHVLGERWLKDRLPNSVETRGCSRRRWLICPVSKKTQVRWDLNVTIMGSAAATVNGSCNNWRAPWKNWISSTTTKLRKSLVKPMTWQNISSCLVLPPKIVTHDAFNVILWMSVDICVVVHDDLGWKNRTTLYNCRFSAVLLALRVIYWFSSADICVVHDDLRWKNLTTL